MKNHNKILYIKISVVSLSTILFLMCSLYFIKISIYGNQRILFYDNDNNNITQNFDVSGITFMGKEYNLFNQGDYIVINSSSYFCKLKINYIDTLLNDYKVIMYDIDNDKVPATTLDKETNIIKKKKQELDLYNKINSNYLLKYLFIFGIFHFIFTIFLIFLFFFKRKCTIFLFTLPILIFIAIILIILNLNQKQINLKPISNQLSLHSTDTTYSIVNVSDTLGLESIFTFSVDNKFWFHEDSLIRYIHSIPVNDTFGTRKEIIQAWKFVYSNTFHSVNFKCDNKTTDLMLNSIGFGLCDNRTLIFCSIIETLGYKIRIIDLKDQHTFSEVYDNKWKLLDVDYGLAFEESGYLLSVEELKSADKFNAIQAAFPMKFLNNIASFIDTIPPGLIDKYCSDSIVISEPYTLQFINSKFILPPYFSMQMPIFDSILKTHLIKIGIPRVNDYIIKLPLLVERVYNVEKFIRLSYDTYLISGSDIEIYLRINPLLFLNSKTFNIYSETKNIPEISSSIISSRNDMYSKLNNANSFLNEKVKSSKNIIEVENFFKTKEYKYIYDSYLKLIEN